MVRPIGSNDFLLQRSQAVDLSFRDSDRIRERLATLHQLNRGADDPSGLIAAEQLSLAIASNEQARQDLDRTRAVTSFADSVLSNAGALLRDLDGLLVTAADEALSPEARDALQFALDAALDALGRLGQMKINGRPVLDQAASLLAGSGSPHKADSTSSEVVDPVGGAGGILATLRFGKKPSLLGDLEGARRVIDDSSRSLVLSRVELGSFQRYLEDSRRRVLEDTSESLEEGRSSIRDADVAEELSQLTRSRIVTSSTLLLTAKSKLTLLA